MEPSSRADRRPALARLTLAATLLAAALPARPARADEPPERQTGFWRKNDRLCASVGVQDLFGPDEKKRLASGFVNRVEVWLYLNREDDKTTVTLSRHVAEVVYDIWDEKYAVRVSDSGGRTSTTEVATADEAVHLATSIWQLPVVDVTRLAPGVRYRLAVRADLNPINPERVKDVRQWLVSPPSGQRRVGPGDSFFGSFVSIFVNPRIEDSERQVRFYSQPLMVTR